MNTPRIQYLHFSVVESTNALASSYLEEDLNAEWLVISADSQSKGRGQMGTTWQDVPRQNVLMSVVSPKISWPVSRVFELNMAVSLALHKVLSTYAEVQLKWPNDILIGKEKLGGILIEPSVRGEFIHRMIIGCGINVLQKSWAEGVNATSLDLKGFQVPELEELRKEIATKVSGEIERLIRTGKTDKTAYLKLCIGFGKEAQYQTGHQTFTANFVDVDHLGRQILQLSDGTRKVFDLKEVKLDLNQSFSS